jgi:hypothetical protein
LDIILVLELVIAKIVVYVFIYVYVRKEGNRSIKSVQLIKGHY